MTLVFATFLPLIAFLIQILGGKRLGKFGSLVATAAIGLGALLSSYEMLSYVHLIVLTACRTQMPTVTMIMTMLIMVPILKIMPKTTSQRTKEASQIGN